MSDRRVTPGAPSRPYESQPPVRVRSYSARPGAGSGSRNADSLIAARSDFSRYGRLTVVLSPLLVMVNVPEVVLL